jgi:hypothetical protein
MVENLVRNSIELKRAFGGNDGRNAGLGRASCRVNWDLDVAISHVGPTQVTAREDQKRLVPLLVDARPPNVLIFNQPFIIST